MYICNPYLLTKDLFPEYFGEPQINEENMDDSFLLMSQILEHRHFTEKGIKMVSEHLKRWSSLTLIKKMQIKSKQETTNHLPSWIKWKELTVASSGNNVEQLELWYAVSRTQILRITLEDCLTVSTEVIHTYSLWFSHFTPMYILSRNECSSPRRQV